MSAATFAVYDPLKVAHAHIAAEQMRGRFASSIRGAVGMTRDLRDSTVEPQPPASSYPSATLNITPHRARMMEHAKAWRRGMVLPISTAAVPKAGGGGKGRGKGGGFFKSLGQLGRPNKAQLTGDEDDGEYDFDWADYMPFRSTGPEQYYRGTGGQGHKKPDPA